MSIPILLVGFRGIGFNPIRYTDPAYVHESELIKAGHVGVSLDGGQTVYGFHPSPEALAAVANGRAFLQEGGALRGGVYDDTEIFRRAQQLAQDEPRTTVWQQVLYVTPEQFTRIAGQITAAQAAGSMLDAWYRFPSPDGAAMPPQCDNCATWPRTLGLSIPEDTGRLRDYIPLLAQGGTPWP